jgi:serine/threonine protein kinase
MADFVGHAFGNYRLTRLLGEGGFAQVYLAEHVYLGTQAAIKILDLRLGTGELDTFYREARTIARLTHPHIVRVLEFGVQDRTPYLVLDYAPHGTLRERYPSGTVVAPEAILPLVQQTAAALQYAHDQHIIHRDVKPENLLLSRDDTVLLSDFGIALVAQTSRRHTAEEILGTVAYMAPEQLHGKPRPESDQYALGVTVYEWLSGRLPFTGTYREMALQQVMADPPSLQDQETPVVPALEQVVRKARTLRSALPVCKPLLRLLKGPIRQSQNLQNPRNQRHLSWPHQLNAFTHPGNHAPPCWLDWSSQENPGSSSGGFPGAGR